MTSTNTPKRDFSRWLGYPLVCLLIAGVLWRVENSVVRQDTRQVSPKAAHSSVQEEYTGTWEEVVTAIPAMIRQLL